MFACLSFQEAEKVGFQAEDVSVALPLCGEKSPLDWLRDNWRHMIQTVMTLASNYGSQRAQMGEISEEEAKEALRAHKGNIWAAVTQSLEQRQGKVSEKRHSSIAERRVSIAERHVSIAESHVSISEKHVSIAEIHVSTKQRHASIAERHVTIAERRSSMA